MIILKYISVLLLSYLMGSVSFSILMSKLFLGGDVRKKAAATPVPPTWREFTA